MLSLAEVLPTFLLITLPSPSKNAADKINKIGLLNRFTGLCPVTSQGKE